MKSINALAWLASICCLAANSGCGKKETPAPGLLSKDKPAPPIAAAPNGEGTGTIKFELDISVDPKTILVISGKEFSAQDLEQPITLNAGKHVVAVKAPAPDLAPREFTVEKGLHRVVRLYDP